MKAFTFICTLLLAFLPFTWAGLGLVDDLAPGDIVSVNRPGVADEREGLVTDTFVDAYGRQIVTVQLDRGEMYRTWYPYVRKVVRKTYYTVPQEPRNYRSYEWAYGGERIYGGYVL
ncbi:hypothetical protein DACRYDRAFT_19724 [Dacryopinax primogenitus]|uniref:Uncharacterized protein n=1 Tax=Dacryopinax primogenitus (strain DJM 731) TaxID=1858805 RepID=M5GH60_DACPD|nr:uncharacterized protein DACRYDRAFT_19724 [Dacryopinax primogenitus]EJU06673.1 hypothetical protein DACRYDRAFT_19724 [Dacryopinax primogenitus]